MGTKEEGGGGGREVLGRHNPFCCLFFFLSGSRHADGVAGTRDRGAAFSDNQQNGDTRASEGMEKVTLMESDELLKKKKVADTKGGERLKSGGRRGLNEK